jgi:hypothetical protein
VIFCFLCLAEEVGEVKDKDTEDTEGEEVWLSGRLAGLGEVGTVFTLFSISLNKEEGF